MDSEGTGEGGLTALADRLSWGQERKRGTKGDSRVLGLNCWVTGGAEWENCADEAGGVLLWTP